MNQSSTYKDMIGSRFKVILFVTYSIIQNIIIVKCKSGQVRSMDSAKYVHNTREHVKKFKKIKRVNRAIQYTVDLINNNINRDVQEECANRLCWVYIYSIYTVYIHSSNADDVETLKHRKHRCSVSCYSCTNTIQTYSH